jgi:hypothetical protein
MTRLVSLISRAGALFVGGCDFRATHRSGASGLSTDRDFTGFPLGHRP